MKVSIENNRRMQKAGIAAIIVILVYVFSQANNSNLILYYFLNIIIGAVYIVLLMYLISILQYARESIAVQNPFSIFLGLEVVRFFSQMFLHKYASDLYTGIGTIELIIFFYILIVSFKVKSKELSGPFKILGVAFLISSFPKLILLFSMSPRLVANDNSLLLANILGVLPFMAILYIISQVDKILKAKGIPEIKTDI